MKKTAYYALYALWWTLSLLPMRVHYCLADVVYLVVAYLLRYRRKIIRKNLADSFPEKSEQERRDIERRFYRWFADYLVESVKLMTITKKNLMRRMTFKGTELIEECVADGQSCAVYLGHYCNWEWVTSLPYWVTPKAQCGQIYHALEDPVFDRLFLRLRQRCGAVCIPMANTLRQLAEYKQQGQPSVIGYISDQVPFWNNIHHWCQFLNHDTPVLTGTERIARRMGQAVFYLEVRRKSRGHYEAEFQLITRHPEQMGEYEITDRYFAALERTISRAPEFWLWSHNRWKRTREEFDRRFVVVNGKVMEREKM